MRKLLACAGLIVTLCAPFAPVDNLLRAALIVCGYVGFCLAFYRRTTAASEADIWLAYASQTGNAQAIAEQSAQALKQAQVRAQCISLNQLPDAALSGTVLFIASTYGEGEPPDNGARFLKALHTRNLSALKYAVLALGDQHYTHFCGFGLALDQALAAQGGTRLADPLTLHQQDPATLNTWFALLSQIAGTRLERASTPAQPFTLIKRVCLNPNSQADKVYHLVFEGKDACWQAGDLIDLVPNNDPSLSPRTYSIASNSGPLELIVRQMFTQDGALGISSNWLTQTLEINSQALGHIRRHPSFHAPSPKTPMILIGAGTGLAGLRAHLMARPAGSQNWLIFGERNRDTDFLLSDEITTWQQQGHLSLLDLAFSRDGVNKRYVQHVLLEKQAQLQSWLAQGAAIYVCGSLQGMGQAVEQTLGQLLGEQALAELSLQGRYRRDLY